MVFLKSATTIYPVKLTTLRRMIQRELVQFAAQQELEMKIFGI
jgi:hypothetical protein